MRGARKNRGERRRLRLRESERGRMGEGVSGEQGGSQESE